MYIITVTGYKGGVGKSTTAIHLAAFFADKGKTLLIDGDPNRSSVNWANRGSLPFNVADERQAMKFVSGNKYIIIDTPARPDSDDLKELSKGCDLLILPTAPDILSLQPMLEIAKDLGGANYKALLTIVPPYPSKEGEIMQRDLINESIPVFRTMIRRSAGFQKAALAGVPINKVVDSRGRLAWMDYKNLGNEILGEIK